MVHYSFLEHIASLFCVCGIIFLLGASNFVSAFFLILKIVHLFQDLISEVAVSPNSEDDSGSFNDGSNCQLNVVNYDNGKELTFPFL
jgi:hypothetical protein